MTYLGRERQRVAALLGDFFRDPGQGVFSGKPRDFVLDDARLNLWSGIREDAIAYFADNGIPWWNGQADRPTGHLLSSQVACVNHLYPLRQRRELATAVLRGLDPEVVAAEVVDTGYVEFEFIGERPYLQERAFTRGANCTSVDACMIGTTADGGRRAYLIEWKYVEIYRRQDMYKDDRAKVYDLLIKDADSPFRPLDPRILYFEPFYQMMRQTLLGWQMTMHGDHGCDSFRHVQVVPAENEDFHTGVTSPGLAGSTVAEAWKTVLKRPEHALFTTPSRCLGAIGDAPDTRSMLAYLARRYWPER